MNELIDNVVLIIERIEKLQCELKTVLMEMLGAMRSADVSGIGACIEREKGLIIRISEQEVLRRQAMEQIGSKLGMGKGLARTMTARMLVEHADEPTRSRAHDRISRLKKVVTDVSRMNRLVRRVSEQTLGHLKQVFSVVTSAGDDAGLYSAGGATVQRRPRELFEAIG